MAFGQSAGPPASGRQVQELLELLNNAGHDDFRDARGPMGFNQRQAGGKFTADEAAALIDQLQTAEHEAVQPKAKRSNPARSNPARSNPAKSNPAKPSPATSNENAASMSEAERALRTASTKSLVLEVRRRGWTVTKPE